MTGRRIVALLAVLVSAPALPQAPQTSPQARPQPVGANNPVMRRAATTWAEICAGCHGDGITAGRAPNLFDSRLLASRTDDALARSITQGQAGGEMPAFGAILPAEQVTQLVTWVRLQTDAVRPKPAFVANPDGAVLRTSKARVRLKVLEDNLDTPWGLAFLPDGRLLVTERPGRLNLVTPDGSTPRVTISGTPAVWERQDSGLLDVAVHPDHAKNGWIYLAYVELKPGYVVPPDPEPLPPNTRRPNHPSMTVIIRGRIQGNAWTDTQELFRAPTELYTASGSHFGSRLLFDGRGHLFFSIGERGEMANSQDPANPLGKIHRINDDGSIPADNPFAGRTGYWPSIWSLGHRNPQGLAFHPVTGQLWESEHGPFGGDEINVIEPGANYGWGVVTNGMQQGLSAREAPGMTPPVVFYTPTIAPSGIHFYAGSRFPRWRNSLFVAALAGQQLRRLETKGGKVTSQEILFQQFGRTRAVTTGPDGLLYVLLQSPTGAGTKYGLSDASPGKLVRLEPLR